ncbi:pyruvate dehydrogenase complex E1 component subunit beta [Candidatus Poribacteria bacterium]|nr:pyruvate dehydrogenase complex E1 component subunit beta [Candidatus Poribacteria bacterium]
MPEMSFREALNAALAEEMERDGQVFLMGEEVAQYHGAYKVSQGLLERFGDMRVVDTPITEAGFVGLGIGAAHVGMKPVIEVMTFNFAILALDQIINNAAKLRYMSGGQYEVPIVIRGPGGAGGALASQHSQALEAQYVHVPGIKVVMPSTPADAKGLLKAAIRDPDPVIFIEAEKLYNHRGEVPEDRDLVLPLGVADIKHPGDDVTIITWSRMYSEVVMPAVETLEGEDGISCEVIDPRTLSPLDFDTLVRSIEKTNRCVIVEEGWPKASVGAWIQSELYTRAFDHLDAPIARLAAKDVPLPYAYNLEEIALPRPRDVVEAVKRVCYRG